MEIDRTKSGWLLIACLLINGPPPDETDSEIKWSDAFDARLKYRTQILRWYCTIKWGGERPTDGEMGWPAEAQQWVNFYLAWLRDGGGSKHG